MTGVFFWNIRGLNKQTKHEIIKKWCTDNNFEFGAVLETRVKEAKEPRFISKVFPGWSSINNYEHHRLGRICVVWKDTVRLTPVFKSDQLITVLVKLQTDESEFLVSFVYASNDEAERRALWSDLQSHHNSAI